TRRALPVEPLRDLDRVGVQLEHRFEARARPVETLDAGDVALDEGARRQAALPHRRLQLRDGRFFQIQPQTSWTRTYTRSNLGDAVAPTSPPRELQPPRSALLRRLAAGAAPP